MENKRRVSIQSGRSNGLTMLNIPFYAKASLVLLGACAFVFMLFIGQQILLPLVFAGIIAVLLNPVVHVLERHHIPRILAIIIAVLVALLVTIIPKVVASKVKLNALISVIVVLAGGALWGILGMFLSIPLSAIAKVICDRIEPLKPWGFLLGDTMPAAGAPGGK